MLKTKSPQLASVSAGFGKVMVTGRRPFEEGGKLMGVEDVAHIADKVGSGTEIAITKVFAVRLEGSGKGLRLKAALLFFGVECLLGEGEDTLEQSSFLLILQ